MISQPNVILVSGGSRGIGRAICLELASRGNTIVFTYLSNESKANELVHEIEQNGWPAPLAYQCDMSSFSEVRQLFQKIKQHHKRVDAIVNNAGILGDGRPFMLTTDDGWWNVIKTNVASVTNTCRVALPMMIAQKGGKIINMTSLSGQKGNPGQSAYSASKSAIVTFSKALSKECGQFGVTINCVSPGLIETDMTRELTEEYFSTKMAKTPLKRKGSPEEVANLVAYLICDAPAYIVGQEMTIDGGIGG
ncbi:3-oxoacyl-[acyl-carrier protein] reductase [Pseudarcicella hirudinis]|uniref:3-oxoacyl-[acyl-carrier protein] reductase n=1 Tax=Pseudarcicella hirudinis TaxID=1079859 RepID=A0A1I5TG34_9BACT|nr:3-oxoacyl-ACP reductase family protein [Pseudarcicella hirudinis]SFP81985.1 3-oxoacyl-[acyl-carrier protein] reductase [Pseudarcicella hirudinis]